MGRVSPIQTSFNAGIFSPRLVGNTEAPRRANALGDAENIIPTKQGPAVRRPGTKYVYEISNNAGRTALLEFEYNDEQAYVIELGDQYARFYRNRGIITEADVAHTNINKSTQATVTAGTHGYSNGDEVIISDTGMWEISGIPIIVSDATASTFKCKDKDGNYIDSTNYTTDAGGVVNKVYEIATPYDRNDLFASDNTFEMRYVQKSDVMFLVHELYAPRSLTRSGHTNWTMTEITLKDGPYLATNATTTTMTPGAVTGSTTLTASATTGINDDAGFAATDVDRLVRLKGDDGAWTWAKITGHTSTTVVDIDIEGADLPNLNAITDWRLGLYSDTTGWPSNITFHENRLCVGGNTSDPARYDLTMTGGFSPDEWTFSPTDPDASVNPDNGIADVLGADGANVIRWMKSFEKGLLIGTSSSEWLVSASTLGERLTPANIDAKRFTNTGSANIQAAQAGNAVLFATPSRRRLHEVAYVFDVTGDGLRAPDMTELADHIAREQIAQMSYQKEPYNCLWCVRDDGPMIGFTYERNANVVGWHYHEIGGSIGATPANVEFIAIIPTPNQDGDDVWMVVKRTINGATKRYVEYLTAAYETGDDQEDAYYVDCGKTYDGSPVSTVTGLQHLEGETLKVMRDGKSHPDVTVSGGSISLTGSLTGSVIHVGYGYEWFMETLPMDHGDPTGSAQNKKKRANRLRLRVRNTLGLKYGPDANNMDEYEFTHGNAYDEATPLYTGPLDFVMPGVFTREAKVRLGHDGVFPAEIQSIGVNMEAYER